MNDDCPLLAVVRPSLPLSASSSCLLFSATVRALNDDCPLLAVVRPSLLLSASSSISFDRALNNDCSLLGVVRPSLPLRLPRLLLSVAAPWT